MKTMKRAHKMPPKGHHPPEKRPPTPECPKKLAGSVEGVPHYDCRYATRKECP